MTWSGASSGEHFLASNPATGAITQWGNGRFNVMAPAGGAAGDGVTLDTAAIVSAYAQRTPQNRPGEVIFPAAYAFLTGPFVIPNGAVTTAHGATIKLAAGNQSTLVSFANETHTDTQMRGGSWDGNGVNQAGAGSSAVINGGVGASLSWNRPRFEDMVILNAGQHGTYFATADHASNPKWFVRISVIDHGLKATGYGQYWDYCPGAIADSCFVQAISNTNDNFEIGHLGQVTLIAPISIGGQIQFPFGDDCKILAPLQINNTIQNDGNTAHNVLITDPTVLNAAPATGYSGVNLCGSGTIRGGHVQITGTTAGYGVGCNAQVATGLIVDGVFVETLASAPVANAAAIALGSGAGSVKNQGRNCYVVGKWDVGAQIVGPNNVHQGHVLDLTAATATYGVYILPSGITGVLAHNCSVLDVQILGNPTNPVSVPSNVTGTLTDRNLGYNPVGTVTQPGIVTTLVTNNTGVACMVFITTGGTNAVTAVSINGVATGQTVPISTTAKLVGVVPARGTIQITGTLTGTTWLWVGAS